MANSKKYFRKTIPFTDKNKRAEYEYLIGGLKYKLASNQEDVILKALKLLEEKIKK